jgi:hypothetical protein
MCIISFLDEAKGAQRAARGKGPPRAAQRVV